MTDLRELSPSEVAARLGTSTRTVQRWISDGHLPARRVGGRWRVAFDALGAFESADARPEGPGATTARRAAAPRLAIGLVFVANRGEIAARVRRTCERLGIGVVVPGEEACPEVDLLDAEAVVDAALAVGADAVHPGYGFLSENADFAAGVEAAGMRWIGPPASAIRAVGDKAAARRLAAGLGVPIVPGYDDEDQSDLALSTAAERIGLPLIVKPSAGGGGKGMHVVRDRTTLEDALAVARREALAAFGDDRLILERYLEGPRHVEVQVLFDAHGNGVQLGERDCSLQRRHQKVLEETPSPAVGPTLRAELAAHALALAGAVGYVSAGTCEFLVDDAGGAYFLEMNARLQVEHPVTELATGRDLVADQLRIAAGQPLGVDQAAIDRTLRRGIHAIEVRLYAEDAEAGFLPATGRIERVDWPPLGAEAVRVDSAIAPGTIVDARYDPMLGKIATRGRDRSEALDRLRTALDATTILGLTTNLRFLRWLVRRPEVVAGSARIDTLERIWPAEAIPREDPPPAAWSVAARGLAALSGEATGPWIGGWRLNAAPRLRLVSDDGSERSVEVGPRDDDELDAGAVSPRAASDADGPRVASGTDDGPFIDVDVDGRSVRFRIAPAPDVERATRAASHGDGGSAEILSPMPGSVLRVHVAVGDRVEVGDPIATIEAMKMEHVVAAPGPGIVREVAIAIGDQVRRGQRIADLGPAG